MEGPVSKLSAIAGRRITASSSAARRPGQRLIHFRATWRASHAQLSARQPGQLQRVVMRQDYSAEGDLADAFLRMASAAIRTALATTFPQASGPPDEAYSSASA